MEPSQKSYASLENLYSAPCTFLNVGSTAVVASEDAQYACLLDSMTGSYGWEFVPGNVDSVNKEKNIEFDEVEYGLLPSYNGMTQCSGGQTVYYLSKNQIWVCNHFSPEESPTGTGFSTWMFKEDSVFSTCDELKMYVPCIERPFTRGLNGKCVCTQQADGGGWVWEVSPDYVEKPPVESSSSSYSAPCPVQSSPSNGEVVYGTLVDDRDGLTYKTVVIGCLTWMAENLNYEMSGAGGDGLCYSNATQYCDLYGRLYVRFQAMHACPTGWRLPSNAEWNTVTWGWKEAIRSQTGWSGDENGNNAFGMNVLPAGIRLYGGGSAYMGEGSCFWTSDGFVTNFSKPLEFKEIPEGENFYNYIGSYGFSVRCVKDSP